MTCRRAGRADPVPFAHIRQFPGARSVARTRDDASGAGAAA